MFSFQLKEKLRSLWYYSWLFLSNGNAIPEDSIGIFIELLKDLSGSIQCDGTSVPKFQWISSM